MTPPSSVSRIPVMVDDVAAVAAGLTKAQRREIAGEVRSLGKPVRWVLYTAITDRRALSTLAALTSKGLLEVGIFGSTMLTPLGLSVRDHILKEQKG